MNEIKKLLNSSWIWCNAPIKANQYSQFIHYFTVTEKAATLFISADTNYAVFINGIYVPGFAFSDYPECRSVDSHDISNHLKLGTNRLCVVAYCQVSDSSTYKSGTPSVRFAIYSNDICIASSGKDTLSRLSPDYKSGEVEKISAQLSYSFHYDAHRYDGWLSEDYAPGSDWSNSKINVSNSKLSPRPIRQLLLNKPCRANIQSFGSFFDVPNAHELPCGTRMQQAALGFRGRVTANGAPRNLPDANGIELTVTDGDGIYILIDLKRETVGLLNLDFELPQDALVMIGFGEHLDDLRVRSSVGGRQFCATYNGVSGRQNFTHYHKRIGCRYLQLHVYSPSIKLYYAGILPVNYPLLETTKPNCSDKLLEKIYDTGIYTLRMCVHEHYEDCPWREQALYAMDSRIQMLCGYYAFKEYKMPRATIDLLAKGIRQDGLLELCAPTFRPRTIPSFSLAFIDCLYDYVLHSKDYEFANNLLPTVEIILNTFISCIGENGFIRHSDNENYWNFYEWSYGLDGACKITSPSMVYAPLQAMFIIAAEKYVELCKTVSYTPQIASITLTAENLRKRCQRFWNEDCKAFDTCYDAQLPHSELVQSLMLCAGVTSNEQKDILLNKLSNHNNDLTPITLSHSIYKYQALMNEPQKYADFVKNDIANIWGNMLFDGATTFWETELGAWDFASAGSLCHGWSAIPVYLLHKYNEYLS